MEPLPFARAPVIKEGLLCAYCLWRTLRPLWPLHLAPVSPLTPLLSLFARRIFARRHRPRSQAWRRRRRARQLEGPLLRAVGPLVLLRVQERACRRGARGAARTAPREGARRLRAHSRRTHARCLLLLLLRAQDYEKKKAPVGRVVLCAYYCTRAAADASLSGDAVRPKHAPRAPQSPRRALAAAATACRRPPPPPLPLCAGV